MLLAYLQEKDYEAAKADPSEELGSMGSRKFRLMVVCEVSNRLARHRNWISKSQSASLGAGNPTLGHPASSLEPREKFGSGFVMGLPRSAESAPRWLKFGSSKPDFGPRSLEFGIWREVCNSRFSLGLPRSAGPSLGSKLPVSKFGSRFPWASRVVKNLA